MDVVAFVLSAVVLPLLDGLLRLSSASSARRLAQRSAAARKRSFLARAGDSYGYSISKKGNIDTWRSREHPSLIPPLGQSPASASPVVYLDYSGAALPSQSLLRAVYEFQLSTVLSNPHSVGPTSSATQTLMDAASCSVLSNFCASASQQYTVVFTSNASHSLNLLSSAFPFCPDSVLFYPSNSHTSVLGCRNNAMSKGGRYVCLDAAELSSSTTDYLQEALRCPSSEAGAPPLPPSLLILPASDNFSGQKYPVKELSAAAKSVRENLFVCLDLTHYVSTNSIDVAAVGADAAVLSFSKLFGYPTGLGLLLLSKRVESLLLSSRSSAPGRYFGGGTVDAVLPNGPSPFNPRKGSASASLQDGTVNYRAIAALPLCFADLKTRGGMETIGLHAGSLGREFRERLQALRHGGGSKSPVAVLYDSSPVPRGDGGGCCSSPTVAFNLLYPDGRPVPSFEVLRLASLRDPPLQLRSGCFCNPGACQAFLGLSDNDVISNYAGGKGRRCGDGGERDVDERGRPTAALRVSFGKDSIFEDVDEFITFIEETYGGAATSGGDRSGRQTEESAVAPSGAPQPVSCPAPLLKIVSMYIFPIKSCAGQFVSEWPLTSGGRLLHDRDFALIDPQGRALRLSAHPTMALLRPSVDRASGDLVVEFKADRIIVRGAIKGEEPRNCGGGKAVVSICDGHLCGAVLCGSEECDNWFSDKLGVRCALARTDFKGDDAGDDIAFANEAPLLLISHQSVDRLNKELLKAGKSRVSPIHFRPNVVVSAVSADPTEDDDVLSSMNPPSNPEDLAVSMWLESDPQLRFTVTGKCARCGMVNVDPTSGSNDGSTLRALAKYRREEGARIVFGVFMSLNRPTQEQQVKEADHWLRVDSVFRCSS